MRADGSNTLRIAGDCSVPVWSPDSRQIAFTAIDTKTLTRQIYVVDADGRNRSAVTQRAESSDLPNWSHDSRSIVFQSSLDAAGPGIYITDVSGGNPRLLSPGANPRWSWTANAIAFEHQDEIFTIRPDGADVRNVSALRGGALEQPGDVVVPWPHSDTQPAWSAR